MNKIKLVIWDLDETFWQGTLSEEGIIWNENNASIVKTLTDRGIINSICSKNDLQPVAQIMEQHDLWQYFIFPSISWSPKGEAVKQIIERAQLRPENVLFIDDNPMNLEEVKFVNEGIHCLEPSSINSLLGHPALAGKDDAEHSRLKQYKVLETKFSALSEAKFDNREFLKQSGITVFIDFDVNKHQDRIIELANRTNQLNFTKVRFNESVDIAKQELAAELAEQSTQAACIFVKDNYGDYGLVGFYIIRTGNQNKKLVHYVFSCRTMNMGIEQWLYQQLGKPELTVKKPVSSDLSDPSNVDWITVVDEQGFFNGAVSNSSAKQLIRFRGACDMASFAHYLRFSHDVEEEVNFARNGLTIRYDSLEFTLKRQQLISHFDEISKLGLYTRQDLKQNFFNDNADIFVYSSMMEWRIPRLKHKTLNFVLPVTMSALSALKKKPAIAKLLKQDYKELPPIGNAGFINHLRSIRFAIPAEKPLFFVLANDTVLPEHQKEELLELNKKHNQLVKSAISHLKNTFLVDFSELVTTQEDVTDGINHFKREVYWEAANRFQQQLKASLTG